MPYTPMDPSDDPKARVLDEIGDISSVEIFNNQLLCAVYVRPEKTKSGLFLPSQTTDEDKIQGKVGLVLKKGAMAFVDDDNKWFAGASVDVGDWVFFRPSDGWSLSVTNPKTGEATLCRILDDTNIRGRIDYPDRIW